MIWGSIPPTRKEERGGGNKGLTEELLSQPHASKAQEKSGYKGERLHIIHDNDPKYGGVARGTCDFQLMVSIPTWFGGGEVV